MCCVAKHRTLTCNRFFFPCSYVRHTRGTRRIVHGMEELLYYISNKRGLKSTLFTLLLLSLPTSLRVGLNLTWPDPTRPDTPRWPSLARPSADLRKTLFGWSRGISAASAPWRLWPTSWPSSWSWWESHRGSRNAAGTVGAAAFFPQHTATATATTTASLQHWYSTE